MRKRKSEMQKIKKLIIQTTEDISSEDMKMIREQFEKEDIIFLYHDYNITEVEYDEIAFIRRQANNTTSSTDELFTSRTLKAPYHNDNASSTDKN